jgi:hypothetical protein
LEHKDTPVLEDYINDTLKDDRSVKYSSRMIFLVEKMTAKYVRFSNVHGLKKWNANNDVYFRTALYRKSQLLRWL